METSLKAGFAQIFSCCPKILSCPKFGGAAAPLAPAARTPMGGRGRELSLSRSREENFSCRDRSQEMYKKAWCTCKLVVSTYCCFDVSLVAVAVVAVN